MQLFISTWEKAMETHYSPPNVFVITGNILKTIIRFIRYYLLASNSIFKTDSMYIITIQICRNLNEHYYYLISTTPMIWQIDTNCSPFQLLNVLAFHIKFRRLKTNLLGLISIFSNYYPEKGTVYLLFLSSHVFTALNLTAMILVSYFEKW